MVEAVEKSFMISIAILIGGIAVAMAFNTMFDYTLMASASVEAYYEPLHAGTVKLSLDIDGGKRIARLTVEVIRNGTVVQSIDVPEAVGRTSYQDTLILSTGNPKNWDRIVVKIEYEDGSTLDRVAREARLRITS